MNAIKPLKINFDGDTIEAFAGLGPRDYDVVLKPTCEAVRLDYGGQYKRLLQAEWATVSLKETVGADGKKRQMVTISRKTFLHWLMTIETRRIKDPAIRAKILKYQSDAQDVLDAAFDDDLQRRDDQDAMSGMSWQTAMKAMALAIANGQETGNQALALAQQAQASLVVILERMDARDRKTEEHHRRLEALENSKPLRIRRLNPSYPAMAPEGYSLLMDYARGPGGLVISKGWGEAQSQGRRCAEIARRLRMEPIKVLPPKSSHPVNAYRIEVLEKWKAGFILARPHYRMPQLFGLDWEPCRN